MLIHPAMLIHLDKDGPLHRQLYDKLKSLILTGGVTPGARLPSSRQLAGDLSVSRNTVLIAYEQLAAEGYLEARHGSGTFVSPVLAAAEAADHAGLPRQGRPPAAHGAGRRSLYSRRLQALDIDALGPRGGFRYDFHYGTVNAADFPVAIWRRLMLREIRRRAGQPYPAENPQGLPELRAALCAYLARARAVRATPEQVLVVNGSQQAIDLAVRVLIDPDTPVVIEEPAYSGARLAFQAARARLLRVPVDEEGMVTSMLPPPGARPRLIYITPSHQFPTGGTMPVSRRLALLDWAKRSGG